MCGMERNGARGGDGGRQADPMSVNRIIFFTLSLGTEGPLIISEKSHLNFFFFLIIIQEVLLTTVQVTA